MHTVMGKKTAPNSEKDAALKMDAGTMNSGLVSRRTAFYLFCQVQSLKLIKFVPFFFHRIWKSAGQLLHAVLWLKLRQRLELLHRYFQVLFG